MNRITLATDDVAFERHLRESFPQTLNGDLRRVQSLPSAAAAAVEELAGHRGSSIKVVALGPGMELDAALDIAHRLDVERPEVSVVLVAEASPELLEQALRAGVRDVLSPFAPAEQVHAAFERAMSLASRRRAALGGDVDEASSHKRIITVVSPKGGSGKTTAATNLALGLAGAAPEQVVLVDLDLQFGDIASALQLEPEATAADLVGTRDLEATAVKVALTPHPSGLYVLCAPESPADAEDVTAKQVSTLLQLLADQFRYVVVDTNAGLNEHTLTAVELSTDLICLCSMDVPSIRGLRKELVALDQLGMTGARRHFVLNRADSRVGLSTADVEGLVGLPVDVAVPSSRAVPLSLNQGSPVIESDPRSAVARQFTALVDRFAERPAARQTGKFLRRMKDAR
ncbi:MAG: AAA family ATPase [Actinomycetota bacterium]|nr:AAA family ATPase [Actinomycetota bacterium]